MLFDIDIFEMIKNNEMFVYGANDEILNLDFLVKYEMIQSASLDIRLNTKFAYHKKAKKMFDMCKDGACFDSVPVDSLAFDPLLVSDEDYVFIEVGLGEKFILPPFGFCLAGTMERVELPNNICYQLDGKSTVGRLGSTTHVTAGFADPGFYSWITCEMFNCNPFPLILRPGMFIGQYKFFKSSTGRGAINPYNGLYVAQPATQAPKTKKLFRYLNGEGINIVA